VFEDHAGQVKRVYLVILDNYDVYVVVHLHPIRKVIYMQKAVETNLSSFYSQNKIKRFLTLIVFLINVDLVSSSVRDSVRRSFKCSIS
jgi:hypothetical protein